MTEELEACFAIEEREEQLLTTTFWIVNPKHIHPDDMEEFMNPRPGQLIRLSEPTAFLGPFHLCPFNGQR